MVQNLHIKFSKKSLNGMYWNCCLRPSQGFGAQIEPQATRWQYTLMNYHGQQNFPDHWDHPKVLILDHFCKNAWDFEDWDWLVGLRLQKWLSFWHLHVDRSNFWHLRKTLVQIYTSYVAVELISVRLWNFKDGGS